MSEDIRQLFEERLGRYQATIALEPTDRMIVAGTGANHLSRNYGGYNYQETMDDINKWIEIESKFVEDFPQVELLRCGRRTWATLYEAVGCKLYSLPGRDLPPDIDAQAVEGEWMKADEYDLLINNFAEFQLERRLPRVMQEFEKRGSSRSYMAFLKGAIGHAMMARLEEEKNLLLETKYGVPLSTKGLLQAPFDVLADGYRGLNGVMIDILNGRINYSKLVMPWCHSWLIMLLLALIRKKDIH